jgi:hypothetical protein
MQVRALSTAAAIVLVALASAACNPATKSKATPAVTVLPATETQADEASPTASPSASAASASSAPAVASASPAASSSSPAATPAPAAGGGSTVDVCSLLTPAQASSINGVTYGTATAQRIAGIDTCDYKNTGRHANVIDIQDLNTQVISQSDCYSDLLNAEGPGTTVSGVGDDAFGYEQGIVVNVGSRCMVISGLTSAEWNDNYAPDAAMAKIMIGNLH